MLRTGIGVLAKPGIQDQSRKSGKSFEWRLKRLEAHRDFVTPHFELLRKSLGAASMGRTAAFMTWHEGRQWTVRGQRKFLHRKKARDQIVVSTRSGKCLLCGNFRCSSFAVEWRLSGQSGHSQPLHSRK